MSTTSHYYEEVIPDSIKDDVRSLDSDAQSHIVRYFENKEKDNNINVENSNTVTKELCDVIHYMREEGILIKNILSAIHIHSHNTIHYHLRGDCTHEYRTRITYDECGWMRFYANNGAPSKTLSLLYNISTEAIARHVTGRCSHTHGCDTIDGQELHNNGRRDTPMTISICSECGDKFEHKEYRERRFCDEQCRNIFASKKAHGKI